MRTRRLVGVVGALLVISSPAVAQADKLTDIRPYLMDRSEEIALARSAAPHDIGADAAVWVLTSEGYRQAASGSNGFACFVGRGWSGPIVIGPPTARRLHPDVFDAALRAPHCFNPAAAAAVLPWHVARTRLLLEGVPAMSVDARMEEELRAGLLTAPAPGAMAYMMSPHQDLGPDFGSWRPHVMVYLPHLKNADWGVARFTNDFPFVAESGSPWAVAVLPMRVYSDDTRAPETVTGRHH
jgi:hypothetical protein